MDFRLTEDQRALRDGMRQLLRARFDREALRDTVDGAAVGSGAAAVDGAAVGGDAAGTALDSGLWRELGQAGLFALRAPQSAGGVGLGLPEAVLLFEEAGRALLPGPLVASHLAGSAGLVAGAEDGTAVVTAVEGTGPYGGPTPPVEHLAAADAVLVLDEGHTVRVLSPGELAARPMRSLDPLTPLHRVHGRRESDSPGARAAGGSGREQAVGAGVLLREAVLLTAALQLGSACRTLEMAVGYARQREQFGRPVGAFQAVQHLCAGMLVRSETARSVVYAAAVTVDEEEISAAKLLADTAAVGNARDCLQVHGGVGFTWEADVHLHLKRAWLRAEQWRTAVTSEERLASALLCPI
ncbi:acyl-CoA dehydrogenase family protein [Streptomyces spirodelae]|uniref:Acyl-CoA/acyl-ACP dehydrogenase n=1 Tax=Streptomyces spirodelae TaxID=2812904 RepID=A0ABS3WTX2_9ACTN|nr:acyl-CoA dehydrogenase family protein [Streptomyces spirodelae]MBO8186574.1 acyl-CoA/acyl-ACP dehydrogenase [Streptomyces spirodelae]